MATSRLLFLVLAVTACSTTAASSFLSDSSTEITGDPGDEEYRVCVESTIACTGGCYNAAGTTITSNNDTRFCEPVQPGYFSPFDSDEQFLCEPGTFSDYESAYFCNSCPSGQFAPSVGSIHCDPCPPGSYNPDTQSTTCYPCDASLYSGSGSDGVINIEGIIFCLFPRSLFYSSDVPTNHPTLEPTSNTTTFFKNPADPSMIDPVTTDDRHTGKDNTYTGKTKKETTFPPSIWYVPMIAAVSLAGVAVRRVWKNSQKRERGIPPPPSPPHDGLSVWDGDDAMDNKG
jgi:hypothetical protein